MAAVTQFVDVPFETKVGLFALGLFGVAGDTKDILPMRVDVVGTGSQRQITFPEHLSLPVLEGMGIVTADACESPCQKRNADLVETPGDIRISEGINGEEMCIIQGAMTEITSRLDIGFEDLRQGLALFRDARMTEGASFARRIMGRSGYEPGTVADRAEKIPTVLVPIGITTNKMAVIHVRMDVVTRQADNLPFE